MPEFDPKNDPMLLKVNPWLLVPKYLIIGSTIRGYTGKNVSFLGKVTSAQKNKISFDSGDGRISRIYKAALHTVTVGDYYNGIINFICTMYILWKTKILVYGFVSNSGSIVCKYFSNQTANMQGDASLLLRARAVLLVDQHQDAFYGAMEIPEFFTAEQRREFLS